VVHVLSVDQKPVPIPDKVIEDLRRVVVSRNAAPAPIVAGAEVTIQRGPFVGVTGKVSSVRGKTLLTIPIAMLGRAVSVQIDAADVKAALK
jgi:transcription antitermination factor NusG